MTQQRERRWKHPIRDIALLLAAIGVLRLLYPVYWVMTARANPSTDYAARLRELVAAAQPGPPPGATSDADGWPALVEAGLEMRRLYEEATGDERGVDPTLLTGGYEASVADIAPDNEDRESIIADLNEQRALARRVVESLDQSDLPALLAEVAASPRAVRPVPDVPLWEVLLPELTTARSLARLWRARMRLAAQRGDGATVVACFEQSLALARTQACQGTLVERIGASTSAFWIIDELHVAIDAGALSPDHRDSVLVALDRQCRWPDATLGAEVERLLYLDFIQRCFTDDGRGGGRLLLAELEQSFGGLESNTNVLEQMQAGFMADGRRQTTRDLNQYADAVATWVALPRGERETQAPSPGEVMVGLPETQVFLKRCVRWSDTVCDTEDALLCRLAALRIRLHIEQHIAAHGFPPAALDDLAPAFGGELPEDPFAADGRFRYAVVGASGAPTASAAAPTPRYLLYSVGWDGQDDTGRGDLRDAAELSSRHAGLDFVICRPESAAGEPE
ncbi:MAG: hypothetical protein R3B68_11165 [Phycisphaerales bacterium]